MLVLASTMAGATELTLGRDLAIASRESADRGTLTLHPYTADLTGLKNEIKNYRETYIVVQSIVVIGLISALATRR